jgi:hypothetical protein
MGIRIVKNEREEFNHRFQRSDEFLLISAGAHAQPAPTGAKKLDGLPSCLEILPIKVVRVVDRCECNV